MPEANPLTGEIWVLQDGEGRTVRGVVADVTSHMIALVSFTGNRFRIAPDRMLLSWSFSEPPPDTNLTCNRRGCRAAGILCFQRGTSSECVCPRHLPVGVHAHITTERIGNPAQAPQTETSPSAPSPTPSRQALMSEGFQRIYSSGTEEPLSLRMEYTHMVLEEARDAATPYVDVDSTWIEIATGDLVVVTMLQKTHDGDQAVAFKWVHDSDAPSKILLRNDFVRLCRPYVQKSSAEKIQPPVVKVLAGEEWKHIGTNDLFQISAVDMERGLVVIIGEGNRLQTVPIYEFAETQRWRKFVRRTIFDRILDDKNDVG